MRRRTAIATMASIAVLPRAFAQAKPIRIIVPFAPGGSADIIPRTIAPFMSEFLKQPVIVENLSGGGGSIGASYVAKAAPDGLTLGVATVSTHGIHPAVMKRAPYDPLRDFVPISNIARVPNVISVHPSVPAKDIKELIQLIQNPKSNLDYGSPGVGSLGHMMGELFKQSTKGWMTHIPYRGGGPALADTVAGHVKVLCDNLPNSLPHIKAGKLKAMAVAWPTRTAQLPDVPTFAEAGLEVLNGPAWFGLVAPKGTSPQLVQKLQQAVAAALAQPLARARIEELGSVPLGSTSEEFANDLRKELAKWKEVAQVAKISLEA